MDPKIYLVGGAVRDHLLGIPSKDRDYVVVGATDEWMISKGFQKVGADFPVYLHPDTGCEYALARQERKTGAGYLGFETRFDPSITLEDDLIRRDLTINAMAMSENMQIIDPYNGVKDLQAKTLRHTSDAFAEDPLRVLRLARFAARYTDFTVAVETIALCKVIVERGELETLPKERIWTELWKGFNEKQPYRMIEVLESTGALQSGTLAMYFGRSDLHQIFHAASSYEMTSHLAAVLSLNPKIDRDTANDLRVPTEIYRIIQWTNEIVQATAFAAPLTPELTHSLIRRTRFASERDTPDMKTALIAVCINAKTRDIEDCCAKNISMLVAAADAMKSLDYQKIVADGPKNTIRQRVEVAELSAIREELQTC